MSAESDRLKRQIDAKLKAVNNKIKRTEKTTGARIAGSQFDPRKDPNAHNRMRSESNLREYLGRLNDFMGRSNQFISGQNGAPIPRGYFLGVYKKNEAAREQLRQKRDQEMGHIKTPTGLSVRQQKAAIPEAGGSSVYGPYRKFDRDAGNIKDFAALQKLNKQIVQQLKPGYLGSEIGKGRDNIRKVAEYLGEDNIAAQVDELNDYQFDLLWFGTNYADRLFLYYEIVKERQEGNRKERKQDRVVETQFAGIGELIDWAKNQTPENNTPKPPTKGKR